MAERTNFTLCNMLAKDADMEGAKHNWDKRLHAILWEYHTTMKTSTGFTPFQLAYGLESRLPIQFDLPTFQTLQKRMKRRGGVHAERSRLEDLMELEETREAALIQTTKAQGKQKMSFDRRLGKRKIQPFQEGEWVMLYDAIRHKRVQKKFLVRYFGPFIISKAWGNNTYDLHDLGGKFFDRVNQDKLKRFHQRDKEYLLRGRSRI